MSRDIGQYKIFNEIGKGSFGKVYKGVDKITNQEVALKFIEKKQKRSRDLKNLRQQNQLLKKINHPNVICLKDVIQTPKQIIIVTDYAGRDLSSVIQQKKRFTYDKVKQYSTQILNAMVYLNQNRIIHRDLKPQNILIKYNHIKICDFGFAKKLSASTNFLQSMKGTPLYLAPEIVRQTKYTDKVDVWSFGCIIYELFTGRTPYYANTYQKLAPLILYQQVQYPKEMPPQLKDLICSMLQKNPSARPSWKSLKDATFFKTTDPLQQRILNGMKQVTSIQIPDKPIQINNQGYNNQNPNQQAAIFQSKVIQKLDNKNEIQTYGQDFKKIYTELMANLIDGNELKKDIIFLHKIKTAFHQRSQMNVLITDQLLNTIFLILSHLIKTKKNFQPEQMNQNQAGQLDDITKNQTLIIGILCLAKVQKNYEMLQKQLRMICLLIKRNFNGISINSQIDEEITEFVTQILLVNYQKMPTQCIRNGLIIIGTLANQAMMTITNSFTYFQKIAEDNLLSKIANIYKKQQKSAIVLECLKQFIHPLRQIPSMNTNNPHHVLHPKVQNVFKNLKQQVAQSLLKTDFISQKSPLQIYSDKNNGIVDYCQVLLQTLAVSKQMREAFLKHAYWSQLLNCKKTKMFLFAYNSIFIKNENKCIIPKQTLAHFTKQSQQNKLINIFIVEMGYDNLKKKMEKKITNQSTYQAILAYEKSILQKISEFIFIEQAVKQKSSKQLYGVLQSTSKCFDQPLIQLFQSIVNSISQNTNYVPNSSNNSRQYCQSVFRKICSSNNHFKPNSSSLFKLMSLFVSNQIIKPLRTQKSIISFFYQQISDFIKREEFQFLENTFEEGFIKVFVSKMIQCLNSLIQIQQSNSNKLSQSSISLAKQIQIASFYRVMFIEPLQQQFFYQHLRYSQKVITKIAQVQSQFINFLGVKVIPMCKNFVNSNNEHLLVQIFVFLSQIARQYPQFNNQILNTKIVKKFKEWLTKQQYSQNIKEKALYLIGNLAKKSQFFFGQFEAYSVIESITICLKNHFNHPKIFKNTIYSVGNISYYSQKFHNQISPMIMYFAKAFQINDGHLKNNLISTVSNLLRFSNVYLEQLIKSEMIKQILKIACQAGQNDQTTFSLVLSVIKKVLPYPEFYQNFGYGQLKAIYQKKNLVGGDSNQTIKKIKEVLQTAQTNGTA